MSSPTTAPAVLTPKRTVSLRDVRAERAIAATRAHAGSIAHAWSLFSTNVATVDLRHASAKKYKSAVKRATEGMPPKPHRGEVEAWLRALVSDRQCSPATANFYLAALKAITNKAQHFEPASVELRELASAFALVRPLKATTMAPRCPPRDSLWLALDACESPAERAFVWLCTSGMRKGEVLGLRPEDYEPRLRRVDTWRQRPDAFDRQSGRTHGRKNGEHHYVQLGDDAARDLEWTLANYNAIRSRTGGSKGLSAGYVFPWAETRVAGLMKRVRAKAPGFHARTAWHGFRHLGASMVAEESGGHVQTVQRFLGDKSQKVAGTYCEPVRGHTEFDAAKLARALTQAKRQTDLLRGSGAPLEDGAPEVPTPCGAATVSMCVTAHPATPNATTCVL